MKKYILQACICFLLLWPAVNAPAGSLKTIVITAPVPPDDAQVIINDIIAVIGLKPNFEVRSSGVPNAMAITYNGKRYIIYNPEFINKLNGAAGNKWAAVSVLAHEIGHHLNGHTLMNVGSQPVLELEADEFSGFILRKMGATLSQSQAAMKVAAAYKPSLTHPGQQERLTAIATGWNNGLTRSTGDMAKYNAPPVRTDEAYLIDNRTQPATAPGKTPGIVVMNENNNSTKSDPAIGISNSKNILGTVNFPSDRTGRYYLTIRYNLVKIVNNEAYLVGKMLATNDEEYPYVLKGDPGYTLFVDKYGKIVTATKQLAGFLKII